LEPNVFGFAINFHEKYSQETEMRYLSNSIMKFIRFKYGFTILIFSLLIVSCSSSNNASSSQVLSFEQASQRVIDELLNPEKIDGQPVILFGFADLLGEGDLIHPYNFFGAEPIPGLTTVNEETWFFWIDDLPGARYSHYNRFVFVDAKSGDIKIVESQWWPVLNGTGLWIKDDDYYAKENWIFSNFEFSDSPTSFKQEITAGVASVRPSLVRFSAQAEPDKHALVINMFEKGQKGQQDFEDDASNMFGILSDSGFKTTYLGPKEDDNPNRTGPPSDADSGRLGQPWVKWMRDQSSQIKPGETLFVYISGHGGADYGIEAIGGKNNAISSTTLASELSKFDPGVNIIVVLEACKSGAFVDNLVDIADVTFTSASKTGSSFGDIDGLSEVAGFLIGPAWADINQDDTGGEYTSSLVQAWNEIQADSKAVEAVRARAAREKISYWEAYTLEAVERGEKYNWGTLLLSSPQVSMGSQATKPTPLPIPTSIPKVTVLEDPIGDGINCFSWEEVTPPLSIDIGEVSLEWTDPETLAFIITFPLMETLGEPIWGGIEFLDPSIPVSESSSDWYFARRGNVDYIFQYDPPNFFPETKIYNAEEGKWLDDLEKTFSVSLYGDNAVLMEIPAEIIPPDSFFYISITDLAICEEVGLGDDGFPAGVIPPRYSGE
jgi:hypothetical protein